MNRVSAGSRSRVASTKSVPSTLETKRKVRLRSRVMLESFVGHYRPEIGAADTDINNVPNALTGVPDPFTAADPVTKRGHLVEHVVDFRHNVFAVEQ